MSGPGEKWPRTNKINKKGTTVNNKKKWTMMNPIWHQMKKRTPSNGQNDQLVHWWLLIHSAPNQVTKEGGGADAMPLFPLLVWGSEIPINGPE